MKNHERIESTGNGRAMKISHTKITKKTIIDGLQKAVAEDTPDCFDRIWKKAEELAEGRPDINPQDVERSKDIMENITMIGRENIKTAVPVKGGAGKWARRIAACAAAAAACLTLGLGGRMYWKEMQVSTIIGLDVNPSVEFSVNEKNKVLKARPLNDDAVEILEDMNLKGVDMKVAVNATIGSMVQKGYLDELKSTVLVTVDNEDPDKAENIKAELTSDIKDILKENNIEGKIIDIALTKNERLKDMADQYGISIGKAAYLLELVDEYPEFTMEELSGLTMDEITQKIIDAEIAKEEAEKAQEQEKMTDEDRREAMKEAIEELKEIEEEAKEIEEEEEKPKQPVPAPVPETTPVVPDDDRDDLDDDKDDLDDDRDDLDDDRDDLDDGKDDKDDLDDDKDDLDDDKDDLDDDKDDLDDDKDDKEDDDRKAESGGNEGGGSQKSSGSHEESSHRDEKDDDDEGDDDSGDEEEDDEGEDD